MCCAPGLQAGDPRGLGVAFLQWEKRVLEGEDNPTAGAHAAHDLPCLLISTIDTSKTSSMVCLEGKSLALPSTCWTRICHLSWVVCRALGVSCCSWGLSPPKNLVCQQKAASKSRGLPAQPTGSGEMKAWRRCWSPVACLMLIAESLSYG